MRKNAANNYEYFFQVGANAKDEITLECGAFTMEGIVSMANIGKAAANKIAFADNEAAAGAADKFGLALTAANGAKSNAYWVVSTPEAAQKTLQYIDEFIQTVDSKLSLIHI